jgi:uncharacterized membrane protein YoaT (DUF817 family)
LGLENKKYSGYWKMKKEEFIAYKNIFLHHYFVNNKVTELELFYNAWVHPQSG